MVVEIDDWEAENLLSTFDTCLNFIDEGIKSGGVLVHWYDTDH
jgi:hypothetical protein